MHKLYYILRAHHREKNPNDAMCHACVPATFVPLIRPRRPETRIVFTCFSSGTRALLSGNKKMYILYYVYYYAYNILNPTSALLLILYWFTKSCKGKVQFFFYNRVNRIFLNARDIEITVVLEFQRHRT